MRNLVFVMILLGGSVLPAVAQKTLEGVRVMEKVDL
jgi:hypothetical protein